MNKLRIGTITFCALVILIGSFALKRNTTSDIVNPQPPAVPAAAATPAGMIGIVTANVSLESEYLPESDTTGLLQESLSIDELLDLVNDDPGDGFIPVDRERFAALLRSDPELRKALSE